MAEAIEAALVRFESTSNHALLRIYRKGANASSRTVSPISGVRAGSSQWELDDDNNNLLTDEGEHVFLVYLWVSWCCAFVDRIAYPPSALSSRFRNLLRSSFHWLTPWKESMATSVAVYCSVLSGVACPRLCLGELPWFVFGSKAILETVHQEPLAFLVA